MFLEMSKTPLSHWLRANMSAGIGQWSELRSLQLAQSMRGRSINRDGGFWSSVASGGLCDCASGASDFMLAGMSNTD
eukprot:5112410-Amphidinium_carterae.1